MNPYRFTFEVEPQADNPLIAHASRAVVHLWVVAADMHEAKNTAFDFLQAERWQVTEEKNAYLATPEQIEALGAEESSNYKSALLEGMHSTFYYWHRSE